MSNMSKVAIVSIARTPIGNFGGCLKQQSAVELGAIVLKAVLKKANLQPKFSNMIELEKKYALWDENSLKIDIDEIIMGNVLQSGLGQNPARQAAIYAGLPKEIPAYTVNKVCGSGMKAIALAKNAISSGNAEIVLAGGMESMSNAPYALSDARWGYKVSINPYNKLVDLLVLDGIYEIFYNYHMGITAENIASMYKFTRTELDEYAVMSNERALNAIQSGKLRNEITVVKIKDKVIEHDERPKKITLDALSKLLPVFKKDGLVTAGNSCGINDGSACTLLMSEKKVEEYGIEVKAYIRDCVSVGLDPAYMGLGPISAVKKLLIKSNLKLADIDIIEVNEAFAAQTLACIKDLNLDIEKLNICGGAIAFGHPIGATGARLIVTLISQLINENKHLGIATLCIGGGLGMAMLLERPD